MEVSFKGDLGQAYIDETLRVRLWGEKIARLYVQRISILYAAKDAREVFGIRSLGLHALRGKMKGKHALRLDVSWRLVVEFSGKEMKVVSVEEVSKHYGD